MLRTAIVAILLVSITSFAAAQPKSKPSVRVEILEGVPDKRSWDVSKATRTDSYEQSAFAFVGLPHRYSAKAHVLDREAPFMVRATAAIQMPAGEYRLLLRSRSAARLFVDGRLLAQHPFPKVRQDAHNPVRPEPPLDHPTLPLREPGQRDLVVKLLSDGKPHRFRLEIIVGSRKTRPEIGMPVVAISKPGEGYMVLSPGARIPFVRRTWQRYVRDAQARLIALNVERRLRAGEGEVRWWQKRHAIAKEIARKTPPPQPPSVSKAMPVHNVIDLFIGAALERENVKPNPLTSDVEFARRASLDVTGLVPSRQRLLRFLHDRRPDRRARYIDELLDDPSWADHWVSYWQDVLAENPALIKPTLNNTGPFRWWLYQALRENYPLDRFATELVMMEGSVYHGAPAAFGVATNNDVPMAAKAHVLARAFLAADMTCARCHDAPYHPYTQPQLFGMAAMLKRGPLKVPATSSVKQIAGERKPHVKVSLPAGSIVQPEWKLTSLAPASLPEGIVRDPKDSRARLAAIITSPANRRFAKVLVNRIWQRYMGVGLVIDPDDWHQSDCSHPELLDYLAHELIAHDYDAKHVARLILNSHAYQRKPQTKDVLARRRLFVGPARRRMTAEQLVDSLFAAVGKEFDCECLTFDPECWQKAQNCPNFGRPKRAWQFVNLSNERDRPALALPVAQGYVDLLTAFGWRASRAFPQTIRDESLTPVQVMTLANGQLMHRLVILTDDCEITELCVNETKLSSLIRKVYERVLSRPPSDEELRSATELLLDGFDTRKTGRPRRSDVRIAPRSASWSHHLHPEATRMQLRAEQAARAGDPPTERLTADWRSRMEDFLWALLNSPEFVYIP